MDQSKEYSVLDTGIISAQTLVPLYLIAQFKMPRFICVSWKAPTVQSKDLIVPTLRRASQWNSLCSEIIWCKILSQIHTRLFVATTISYQPRWPREDISRSLLLVMTLPPKVVQLSVAATFPENLENFRNTAQNFTTSITRHDTLVTRGRVRSRVIAALSTTCAHIHEDFSAIRTASLWRI